MMWNRRELKSYYSDYRDPELERGLVRAVFSALRESYVVGKLFDVPEEKWLRGQGRWALINRHLREELDGMEGVVVREESVDVNGFPFLIVQTPSLLLHASKTNDPELGPKSGAVRDSLVESYIQGKLPNVGLADDKVVPIKSSRCFGNILYGPRPDEALVPACIEIGFPCGNNESWVHRENIIARQREYYSMLRDHILEWKETGGLDDIIYAMIAEQSRYEFPGEEAPSVAEEEFEVEDISAPSVKLKPSEDEGNE
jgi:hypothetical protein